MQKDRQRGCSDNDSKGGRWQIHSGHSLCCYSAGVPSHGGPEITGREGCSHDISKEGQQAGDEAAEDDAGGSADQADHRVLEAPHGRQDVAKLVVKALKDGLAVHLHPNKTP